TFSRVSLVGTPTSMFPIRMRWRQNSRRAVSSSPNHSRIRVMACGDSSSRTPTATSCFSVVPAREPVSLSLPADRQPDLERAAAASFARDRDLAAMGADVGADDAEAQPEAALGPAAVAAVEAIPDPRLFLGRNPGTRVGDRDDDAVAAAAGGER